MSDTIISVQNLSKCYLVGHRSAQRERYSTLRDVIGRGAAGFARKAVDLACGRQIVQGDHVEEFWALKNVSFDVKRGEVVGIIGRNGAGKSTLLKILSRITDPTEGCVRLSGRIASLLEVGTGFHSELTGRENVFLNGAILGMTQREIQKKFDDIVAFAEVTRFLDTPVKNYSSGMYVRLAFAVAAHLEPEILIVDEVLAVGDASFQKKCLGKIEEVSRREGRTVVFVSHNMGAMASLCPSVIWLDNGSVRRQGAARDIINEYLVQRIVTQERCLKLDCIPRLPDGDDRLRLDSLEWLCDLPLRHGQPAKARIHFTIRNSVSDVCIGLGFSTLDGGRVLTYETDFSTAGRRTISQAGSYSAEVEVESLPLAPDIYNLDVGCRSGDAHLLDYLPSVAQLEVIPGATTPGHIIRQGAGVRLPSAWTWG